MAANEAVVPTETEKTSSFKYVKRPSVQLKIKCRIEEFDTLMNSAEPGEASRRISEGVSSELAPRAVWVLEVYPNGEYEEERGNISIYLLLTGPMKDNGENLNATYHLYLVDASGKVDMGRRERVKYGKESYGWGWGHVDHNRVMEALHADGSLVVVAEVEFLAPGDDCALRMDLQRWPAKFSKFHSNRASSNCSIEIGGVSIPAHKLPLMACSPVFEEMFTNPAAEESKSGVVKITDFKEPEPMRAVVRYCYQGFLDDVTMDGDWAVETFKLAEKYCVDDLKVMLEEHFIEKRLGVENVVEMVVLADSYFAPRLKQVGLSGGGCCTHSKVGPSQLRRIPTPLRACSDLIIDKWEFISESAEWEKLEREEPELAAELAEDAIYARK